MRNFKRIISLICMAAILLGTLAGCFGQGQGDDTSGSTTGSAVANGQKVDYTVNLSSAGGIALSGVTIFVYSDETLEDLEGYGVTDDSGNAVINLPFSSSYRFVLSGVPEGYIVEESYAFVGTHADLTLNSQVIADTDISGVSYTLGSVMHDIVFTDTEGTEYKLSELLKEKELVVINLWYTTCSWCIKEFPYMESTYQQYKDDIEILALNPTGESDKEIADFKSMQGLSFPMGQDEDGALYSAFAAEGCPTSIFIDRYGVVCLIESGAITSEAPFISAYEHFTRDDYTQTLFTSVSELTPVVKPNVSMPSSDEMAAVLNKGDITVTYSPETEDESAEFCWPFVIGQKDGVNCVYPSNAGVDGSFAILYANIELKAGQAIAFDYLASSESGLDILYVLVDRNDIYQISGQSTGWNKCYPFVAEQDGTYELALCFLKDESDAAGDDTVYLKDLRVVSASEIDVATFIPRFAANNLKEDGFGYENYATVVYNEADGYYHVGSKNGPLLLANLMSQTRFSNDSVYSLAVNGEIVVGGKDYYDELLPYFTMASNSEIYAMCTVNKELAELLKKIAEAVGLEGSENEWLQICGYYDTYGTGGAQLIDPVRGLSAETAIQAEMGKKNEVTYNRVIMPRGLLYKFVPQKSGVYRITSDSDYEVNAWVFLEENLKDRSEYYVYESNERMYSDPINCSMVLYMEAGVEYFIDIAFYDVYQVGTLTFEIEYEGRELELFVTASPGYFTFYENDSTEIENGGINVALGDDGYYHELLDNGKLGSILYADFQSYTGIFNSVSLKQMAETDSFDFRISETDQWVLDFMEQYGDDYDAELKKLWEDTYDENMEIYQVEDVAEGIYHGDGENMTALAKSYVSKMIGYSRNHPEREGCVPVDEELAELLQMLMDKFTFEGVDHSWTKLCFYYDYMGPDSAR